MVTNLMFPLEREDVNGPDFIMFQRPIFVCFPLCPQKTVSIAQHYKNIPDMDSAVGASKSPPPQPRTWRICRMDASPIVSIGDPNDAWP